MPTLMMSAPDRMSSSTISPVTTFPACWIQKDVNNGIFKTEQQVISILCLGKHQLGSHTMMVWLGNFPRTVLTNSTKCSEYPLATSRQMYLISGIASRMLHSLSRSACPLPELAATCWEWEKRCCIFSHHESIQKTELFLLFLNHYSHKIGTAAFSLKNYNALPGSD